MKSEHVVKSRKYLKKQYKNTAFTSEIEQTDALSFLDMKTSHEDNKFVFSIYRKPFSGVFTNLQSFISKSYKCSLIDTSLYREVSLCSNMERVSSGI